jgi:hypothetical protein
MVSHNVKGFVTGQPLSYTSDMPDSDNNMIEMMRLDGTQVPRRLTEGLERGLEYEFRLAGRNTRNITSASARKPSGL